MSHPWLDGRPAPLDDAAAARPPGAQRTLILTMDVITPIVDDPHAFGAIAAANAMSDVYAMGGRPELGLSFVGLPTDKLPPEVLDAVFAGMHEACARAGCAVVGGHTIIDTEPKCGLAVVGSADPQHLWSQRQASPGQALVLSKALGTGLIGHAVRRGTAAEPAVAAAVEQMLVLNDVACRVGLELGATACTDVTGFGLLGHLKQLVHAAGVRATVRAADVPLLETALDIAAADCVPGGTRRNLSYVSDCTRFDDKVNELTRLVLADAQTSGGLLLCLPAEQADRAVRALRAKGCPRAARIGELARAEEPFVEVV